jgi:hypothetical protein
MPRPKFRSTPIVERRTRKSAPVSEIKPTQIPNGYTFSLFCCACGLSSSRGRKMDEFWPRQDLLFLRCSLAQGMSFAQAAGFLCRDKDEVQRKAKKLRLSRVYVALSVPPMGAPAVRLRIKEAQSAIQKAGIPGAIDRCLLLLDRIRLPFPRHSLKTL